MNHINSIKQRNEVAAQNEHFPQQASQPIGHFFKTGLKRGWSLIYKFIHSAWTGFQIFIENMEQFGHHYPQR